MQLTVEVSTHFDLPHSGRLPALGLELVKAILKANDPVGCEISILLNAKDRTQDVALAAAVKGCFPGRLNGELLVELVLVSSGEITIGGGNIGDPFELKFLHQPILIKPVTSLDPTLCLR